MNLSDYRTRLSDLAGNDSADAETYYNRVINDAYLKLGAMTDWWWLETYEILRFSAPVTSKSFVANVGATALTAVATADYATTAYAFGWAATGEQTYRVASVASANVILDAPFIEATGTYSIALWNDQVEVNAACDRPIALIPRNDPNTRPLKLVDLKVIENYGADLSDRAQEIGSFYAVFREPVYHSAKMLLRIFPPPDEVAEYLFRFKSAPTAMANDTASTLIPPKFEPCLVAYINLSYLRQQREDPMVLRSYEAEFQEALISMQQAQSRSTATISRMGRRGYDSLPKAFQFKLNNVEAGGI